MKLTLWHCKNPDLMYGQGNGTGYRNEPTDPCRLTVEVDGFVQARQTMLAWIERNGLGGGNLRIGCGYVFVDGRIVARVSYNGRIWTPHEDWLEQVELVA